MPSETINCQEWDDQYKDLIHKICNHQNPLKNIFKHSIFQDKKYTNTLQKTIFTYWPIFTQQPETLINNITLRFYGCLVKYFHEPHLISHLPQNGRYKTMGAINPVTQRRERVPKTPSRGCFCTYLGAHPTTGKLDQGRGSLNKTSKQHSNVSPKFYTLILTYSTCFLWIFWLPDWDFYL